MKTIKLDTHNLAITDDLEFCAFEYYHYFQRPSKLRSDKQLQNVYDNLTSAIYDAVDLQFDRQTYDQVCEWLDDNIDQVVDVIFDNFELEAAE